MNEPTPTHILLRQMKSADDRVRDCAFETLMQRFYGPFERYAREKLGEDDAPLATDDTLLKIYTYRNAYNEKECACKQECRCIEARAHRYLWSIHEHTVIDWMRKQRQKRHLGCVSLEETSDEMWIDPKTPEAYVEDRITQEIILRVLGSLIETDQQLLSYKRGPGRPNPALEQACCEARRRFRIALAAALAEEEQTKL